MTEASSEFLMRAHGTPKSFSLNTIMNDVTITVEKETAEKFKYVSNNNNNVTLLDV